MQRLRAAAREVLTAAAMAAMRDQTVRLAAVVVAVAVPRFNLLRRILLLQAAVQAAAARTKVYRTNKPQVAAGTNLAEILEYSKQVLGLTLVETAAAVAAAVADVGAVSGKHRMWR